MNSILKFKQGKKIMRFLRGGREEKLSKGLESVFNWAIKLAEPAIQTARYYYNIASPFIPFGIQTASIANKVVNGIYPENKLSKELKSNKTSSTKEENSSSTKQEVKNKKVNEVPESILMTELSPNLLKVDLSTANRTPVVSLQKSAPTTVITNPVVSLKVLPAESTIKVTLDPYANSEKTFTGDWIRSQRPLYSNVDELYNFINTYQDSREGLLIRNVLGNNFTLDLFINLLKELGIRGNLGRRDSGRLANYFTTLKYKNGGLLSRNPIERFKIKKCNFLNIN